jgi:hypothetical protein
VTLDTLPYLLNITAVVEEGCDGQKTPWRLPEGFHQQSLAGPIKAYGARMGA